MKRNIFLFFFLSIIVATSCKKKTDPLSLTYKMNGDHYWSGVRYDGNMNILFTFDSTPAPISVLNNTTIVYGVSPHFFSDTMHYIGNINNMTVFTSEFSIAKYDYSFDTIAYDYSNNILYQNTYSSHSGNALIEKLHAP